MSQVCLGKGLSTDIFDYIKLYDTPLSLNIGGHPAPPSHCPTFPPCQLTLVPGFPKYNTMQIQIHTQLQLQICTMTHTLTNTTQFQLTLVFCSLKYNTIHIQHQYNTIQYKDISQYMCNRKKHNTNTKFCHLTNVPGSTYITMQCQYKYIKQL